MGNRTFQALNVSSKFAICGMPIRVDTYKTCSFACSYCFSNCRKVMEFEKTLKVASIDGLSRKLDKVLGKGEVDESSLLEVLLSKGITWHCGGMSDPFQPIEGKLHITKQMIDVANRYGIHILFSTKGDSVYGADIRPDLHTFQLSVTNVDDRRDIEPNVPSIESRLRFFRELKSKGFKVGIRIQPFIPNVTDIRILEMFKDADHVTIEGLKLVPQNKEHKDYLLRLTGLKESDFTQMGLLCLKPSIRLKMYEPFIDWLESHGVPYSIADNDLRFIGTSKCCCGDALVPTPSGMSTTELMRLREGGAWELCDALSSAERLGVSKCRCDHLFTSNRTQGCKTVEEFISKRFWQKSSPMSPMFQFDREGEAYEQLTLF